MSLKLCSKNHGMSDNNNSNNHIGHSQFSFSVLVMSIILLLIWKPFYFFFVSPECCTLLYLNDVFIIFITLRSNFFNTED